MRITIECHVDDETLGKLKFVWDGLSPIIAVLLYDAYESALPVAIYVGVACVISGISALLARETRGVELAAIK